MKFEKVFGEAALAERQGVPEHPKAAARKRRETEQDNYGEKTVKEIYKTAEKMKKEPGIDNPFALAHYLKEPKFAAKRQAAAQKAAATRAGK